jgi:hypothetical protein
VAISEFQPERVRKIVWCKRTTEHDVGTREPQ